jgi:hypothetical protein
MTINSVDCTGLNPTQISNLAKNGIKYVGRYLSRSTWKGLTLGETANIKAAGMQIFSIYETNPTSAGYFSAAKGKSDAVDAINLAHSVGQPEGTAIYFTVDYDAQAGDLANILSYFNAIRANLGNYKLGAYGSFTVLNYLHQNNAADYWFQTTAWSSGQHCSFLNIYQYQIDKTNWNNTGANVDLDNLERDDIGAWGQVQQAPQPQPTIDPVFCTKQTILQTLRCDGTTDIRKAPDHRAEYVRDTQKDETFHVFDKVIDSNGHCWDNLGGANWVDEASGVFYWLDNPALKAQPVYYVIKSGDTLSKIASANGTTVSQLQAWNSISDPNKIFAGQKIRVK